MSIHYAVKKSWIINQYGSLISNGPGRHRYLSKELPLGYTVSLISARWSHVTKDEYLSIQTNLRFLKTLNF